MSEQPYSALDQASRFLGGFAVTSLLLLGVLIAGYLGFCLVGTGLCMGWIAAYQWIEHEDERDENAPRTMP